MNKHFLEALQPYGLSIDGKQHLYGAIGGYEVNVLANSMGPGPIFVFSTYLPEEKKAEFVEKIGELKGGMLAAEPFVFGVSVQIAAMTAKAFAKKLPETMEKILAILDALGARKSDACPYTGNPMDGFPVETITLPKTEIKIRIPSASLALVNQHIEEENKAVENAPNHYLKGFAGILIGAVAGLILTLAFGFLGYITAVSPLVSIFLGVYLYRKFGGKPTWAMIVMSFATTLIVILGGWFGVYVLQASAAMAEAGFAGRGLDALRYCLNQLPDFQRVFYTDLGVNVFFILVAEGISIFRLLRAIRSPKALK